jgi:hypothetical protein
MARCAALAEHQGALGDPGTSVTQTTTTTTMVLQWEDGDVETLSAAHWSDLSGEARNLARRGRDPGDVWRARATRQSAVFSAAENEVRAASETQSRSSNYGTRAHLASSFSQRAPAAKRRRGTVVPEGRRTLSVCNTARQRMYTSAQTGSIVQGGRVDRPDLLHGRAGRRACALLQSRVPSSDSAACRASDMMHCGLPLRRELRTDVPGLTLAGRDG